MHAAIALLTIFAVWRWSDWKNWRRYHPSMLFIATGGLLYEFITSDQTMWRFHPDFLYNHTVTVIIYAVLTMPLTVLLYLDHYPETETIGKKIRYICLWIGIYIAVETILLLTGRISYEHGWNLFYSLLFDMMMFPMIRLHHTRPLLAYVISIPIVVVLTRLFEIKLD